MARDHFWGKRVIALIAATCTFGSLTLVPMATAASSADASAQQNGGQSQTDGDAATDTTDAQLAPADAGVMAADAAADAEADAGEAAGSTADTAADAFTAGGQNFATFKEALAEAVKTDDKTVIINASASGQSLTVDNTYEGVVITAAEGVTYTGTLRVNASKAIVKGMTFKLDPATSKNAQNVIVSGKASGVTVTGNTFEIAAGDPATGALQNKDWQPSSVWLENGANGTVVDKNEFTLGQVVNNSAVGVNIIGNGNSPIVGTTITNNTVTSGPISGKGTSGTMMFVVGNGNTAAGAYGITDTTFTGNTVRNGTGLAASQSKTYGIAVTATKNTVIDDNVIEGFAAISYSTYKPDQGPSQGPNDELTVTNNELNAFAGVLMGDYVTEGGLITQKNTFGGETKYAYNGASVAVANQDGKAYSSVQKAVDAGAVTITLLQKAVGSVTIPAGRDVTLDLNGYTLVNASEKKTADADKHTITNNGRLIVTDSSAGKTGVVDNVTHGKAALSNEEGATATLKGGTFQRSAESENGNSYYVLLNHGDLTINEPTKVVAKNTDGTLAKRSSLIDNGWFSGEPTKGKNATLVINGGTFEGGNYIKNDSYGELTINGGTIKGTSAAVFNWNKVTINGGDFSTDNTGTRVIWNGGGSVDKDTNGANVGQLTITGGTFNAAEGQTTLDQYKGGLTEGQKHHVEVKVSGGTFNGALADDLVNVRISGGQYTVRPSEGYLADGFEFYRSGSYYHVKEKVTPTPPPASKKLTSITGVAAADAWYDGQAHAGYTGEPTSDFKGTYTVTYSGTGSTKYGPSAEAPKAAGTYRVTISVPSTDSTWYGSVAVDFSIRSGSTVVSRFYTSAQGVQGLHMWTTSDAESAALGASGWGREGDAFAMDAHVGAPVFRLYDPAGNQHLWTVSEEERDHLVSVGWNDEGVAFYENPTADVDVYRLYNPWTGEHLLTTSLLERDTLASLPDGAAWTYEGVAFKALA